VSSPGLAALVLGAACALAPALALAQRFETTGVNVQKAANAVLSMMGLMLTPDVTTGSLSFSNDATGNPDFSMTSLGGGFTTSKAFPLYLEAPPASAATIRLSSRATARRSVLSR